MVVMEVIIIMLVVMDNGQTALYCRTNTILVNNGQIGGGGGGSGGGPWAQCVYVKHWTKSMYER